MTNGLLAVIRKLAVRMAGLCQFILALPQAQHPHILLLDDKTRFSKAPPLCEETMCDTFRLPMAFDF